MLFAGVLFASLAFYRMIPTTFLPIEDRGRFITVIRTPEGSTSAYTKRALEQVEQMYLKEPEIEGFFASIGMSFGAPASSSLAMVFSRLSHWDEREEKQQKRAEQADLPRKWACGLTERGDDTRGEARSKRARPASSRKRASDVCVETRL